MLESTLAATLDAGRFDLVVTSGQRLAREIGMHQARLQLAAGHAAWQAVDTLPWSAFMRRLYEGSTYLVDDAEYASRQLLNGAQARSLWRDVVHTQLQASREDMLGADALVGEIMQAFALLRRFCIAKDVLAAAAIDDDSRFFVACLERMTARLEHGGWLLDEDLPAVFSAQAASLATLLPARILLAGFEQLTPDQQALIDAFPETTFIRPPLAARHNNVRQVQRFESHRDELIAAGGWARAAISADGQRRVAVVVPGLSAGAADVRRWFAEGFMPAGQCDDRYGDAFGFELSYGQPLADYPAVASALELLQLAVSAPRFGTLSRLLRCAVLNDAEDAAAVAVELQLRELPDRRWSLEQVIALVDGAGGEAPAWLLAARRLQQDADSALRPAAWAARIDTALSEAGWLTGVDTDSEVFQMRNAFHALLNALASLDRLIGETPLAPMLAALRERAQSTVYQPQGAAAGVLICGPLETPGLAFDGLWIAGLDGERWPPAGRASSLLPRRLQRDFSLPDATPEQSRIFWQQQFGLLAAAADNVVCSFAYLDGDSERLPSPVLDDIMDKIGWHEPAVTLGVAGLAGEAAMHVSPDPLGRFDTARRLHGGYSTLQMLNSDPFTAAVTGRWRCRALREPGVGMNGAQRGQVLHRALQDAFASLDSSERLASAGDSERRAVVAQSVATAMRPWFASADDVLAALLRMEERRCRLLLDRYIATELSRPAFDVVAREAGRELSLGGLRINLRIDRIDRVAGAALIIDYKTGSQVALVKDDSLPDKHFQLLMYALTERGPLAGLAIARIGFEGEPMYALVDKEYGALPRSRQVAHVAGFDERRKAWEQAAQALAERFIDGDVRINPRLSREDRLPTALLCRIAGEHNDDD